MKTLETIEPVRKHVVIAAPQAHVFRVFTDGIDSWWPREHHTGTSPLARAVLEPRMGGRWYSVGQDGTESDVGKVLEWDPPRRLVLAWQLTTAWQFDPDFITEVEVNFTAEGPRSTRVDLEHRNLARFGATAPQLRESIDSPTGWGLIMANFAAVAAKSA